MIIAVLGSGNGGCAVAFDWAAAGHRVNIFDFEQFPTNIDAISQNGGVYADGDLKGFAPIEYAGHDLEKVLSGSDLIFVVGPAYSTEPFANVCKNYLKDGQVYIICPGSCGGALLFKKALGLDIMDESVTVAETSTLPYAVRLSEPGKIFVHLKLKGGYYISTIPTVKVKDIIDKVREVYCEVREGENILRTILQNANPCIHPAVSLLNAALIERTHGDFYFYEEGVTPAVGRLIEAVDNEKIKIGKHLGIEIIPDPVLSLSQGYMQVANYDTGYSTADGFKGIKAQSSLDYRYFNEDVGYGLVFISDLGRKIGVQTPVIDSIINIVSTIMQRDYRKENKRNLEVLGLDKYTPEELGNL